MFKEKRHEKIIYENNRGERIDIAYSFPFFLNQIMGVDGTDAELTSSKGVGQDGTTIENVSLGPRPIQIIGYIKGFSKEELAKYRAKLLRVFNPKIKGTLQYEYGDIKRKISCQVDSAPIFSKQSQSFKYLNFMVNLLAPNPYWQDLSTNRTDIAIWQGAFEFPLELLKEGIEMGYREPSLIVNVFNDGDVETGLKIQFKALATVTNPSLFNINTREEFKINKIMEVGEVITVTTHFGNKRVELNKNGVVTNAFNWIVPTSVFLQLDIGDNLFRYDADEGIDNLDVSIWHNSQYLGV